MVVELYSKFSAIFLRSNSSHLAEETDEITMVAKSKFVGNLFHRTIRGEEQQLGAFHLFTVDVLNRCLGKFLLEKPDEVGLGDGCHTGQLCHVYLIGNMFMNMLQYAFHALIGCPKARFRLPE